jgi:hypothetical protein
MATEVTATISIGPLADNSNHGRPIYGPTRKLFCPSHVLVLMEGARAAWIVQRCPELRRPTPTSRILPASPQHLLAAAILGYAALTTPRVIDGSDRLRLAVEPGSCGHVLRLKPIDDGLASEVFATCGEVLYGMVTVLPGSSISDAQLRAAAATGMQVATPRIGIADPDYSLN